MSIIKRGSRLFSSVIKRYFASESNLDYLRQEHVHPAAECQKSLKIAILGMPNSGKSTLINQLVHRPVCAASSKVHTTRVNAFAIYTEENKQLVFIDTPGLINKGQMKRYKFEATFPNDIKNSLDQADVIGIVQDMATPEARISISGRILNIVPLAKSETPFILILNKVDLLKDKKILLNVVDKLTEFRGIKFSDIFMLSALKNNGVDDLRNYFLDMAKPSEWSYNKNIYTDQKLELIIERIVKAKLLDNVAEDVPYTSKVSVSSAEFDEVGNLNAIVVIYPKNKRAIGMIKGSGGRRIRIIALQTEQELCNIFHTGAFVKIIIHEK